MELAPPGWTYRSFYADNFAASTTAPSLQIDPALGDTFSRDPFAFTHLPASDGQSNTFGESTSLLSSGVRQVESKTSLGASRQPADCHRSGLTAQFTSFNNLTQPGQPNTIIPPSRHRQVIESPTSPKPIPVFNHIPRLLPAFEETDQGEVKRPFASSSVGLRADTPDFTPQVPLLESHSVRTSLQRLPHFIRYSDIEEVTYDFDTSDKDLPSLSIGEIEFKYSSDVYFNVTAMDDGVSFKVRGRYQPRMTTGPQDARVQARPASRLNPAAGSFHATGTDLIQIPEPQFYAVAGGIRQYPCQDSGTGRHMTPHFADHITAFEANGYNIPPVKVGTPPPQELQNDFVGGSSYMMQNRNGPLRYEMATSHVPGLSRLMRLGINLGPGDSRLLQGVLVPGFDISQPAPGEHSTTPMNIKGKGRAFDLPVTTPSPPFGVSSRKVRRLSKPGPGAYSYTQKYVSPEQLAKDHLVKLKKQFLIMGAAVSPFVPSTTAQVAEQQAWNAQRKLERMIVEAEDKKSIRSNLAKNGNGIGEPLRGKGSDDDNFDSHNQFLSEIYGYKDAPARLGKILALETGWNGSETAKQGEWPSIAELKAYGQPGGAFKRGESNSFARCLPPPRHHFLSPEHAVKWTDEGGEDNGEGSTSNVPWEEREVVETSPLDRVGAQANNEQEEEAYGQDELRFMEKNFLPKSLLDALNLQREEQKSNILAVKSIHTPRTFGAPDPEEPLSTAVAGLSVPSLNERANFGGVVQRRNQDTKESDAQHEKENDPELQSAARVRADSQHGAIGQEAQRRASFDKENKDGGRKNKGEDRA